MQSGFFLLLRIRAQDFSQDCIFVQPSLPHLSKIMMVPDIIAKKSFWLYETKNEPSWDYH